MSGSRVLRRLLAVLVVTGLFLSGLTLTVVVPAALAATATAREVGNDGHPLGRLLAPPATRSVVRAADGSCWPSSTATRTARWCRCRRCQ